MVFMVCVFYMLCVSETVFPQQTRIYLLTIAIRCGSVDFHQMVLCWLQVSAYVQNFLGTKVKLLCL